MLINGLYTAEIYIKLKVADARMQQPLLLYMMSQHRATLTTMA